MALGEYNFDAYKLYLLTHIIYNYSLGRGVMARKKSEGCERMSFFPVCSGKP